MLLLTASVATPARAQPAVDPVDAARTELERLGKVCETLGLTEAAQVSRSWLPETRRDQRLLYLPVGTTLKDLGVPESPQAAKWLEHFTASRVKLGQELFERATSVVSTDEGQAYRLLWQCLREDPEHDGAKAILGGLARAVNVRPRVRSGSGAQPDLNWSPRSYLLVSTPHFNLLSKAGRGETLRFAVQLEQYYALWTQVFAEVWLQKGKLADAIGDSRSLAVRRNRFDVVLLQDRQSYLEMLSQAEDNASVSVGYYSPDARKSLFYISDDLQDTLYHELTHQILAEGCDFKEAGEAGKSHSYWMIEGTALYMESLSDRGSLWSIGGWESPRLQTARYRGVRDGFWPAMQKFASGTMESWKADPEIATLYSHSAGLTHMFMDGVVAEDSGREFMSTLAAVYSGADSSLGLLKRLGNDDDTAKQRYQQLMTVDDEDVARLSRSPWSTKAALQDIVLSGSTLNSDSWKVIAANSEAATWIDLAYTNVSNAQLEQISASARWLTRLNLEGTRVNGESLQALAKLKSLRELDLSDCPVDDTVLKPVVGIPSLETLWLTRTSVSVASLPVLETLPKLQRCDLSGTKIPPEQQNKWK